MSRAGDFLHTQFNNRKVKNPRYSQRAFANLIGINSGRLTQYFSGERFVTKNAAKKIGTHLRLDNEQQSYFLYLCDADRSNIKTSLPRLLKDDELAMIVEWHHLAILSLTSTKDFKYDVDWISKRMALPVSLVESSLARLERIGMIKIENGKLHRTPGGLTTTNDIPNKFLSMFQQNSLRYITENMPQVPLDKREVTSVTLPVNEQRLAEAKERIRTFRRKLAVFLSQGNTNQVYTFNMQLFPLSKVLETK